MFRIISNLISSFVRTATLAQRLDDAVSFADGQCELVANLQSELANTYRRIDALRTDVEVNQLQVEALLDHLDEIRSERDEAKAAYVAANREWSDSNDQVGIITYDNAILRRSLAEMRTERDALRNEVATLRAAATQRAAGYDSDPYDGLSPADR